MWKSETRNRSLEVQHHPLAGVRRREQRPVLQPAAGVDLRAARVMVRACATGTGPGASRELLSGGCAAELEAQLRAVRLLSSPPQPDRLPARGNLDRRRDVLLLQRAGVQVPRIGPLRIVRAERGQLGPAVLVEALRAVPVDEAVDRVPSVLQMVVDDDLGVAVAVEVERLDAARGLRRQLRAP